MIVQKSATKYEITVGSTIIILDSSIPNGMGDLHGQIIDLVTGSPDELARFEQLLGWNSNLAFVSYCIEKGLVIPPDPEVAPEPSE